jgi:histidinol phosphatase-like PHP family hydrolase/predicted nuclease with RNAse H fold/dephospho-CoA kinase
MNKGNANGGTSAGEPWPSTIKIPADYFRLRDFEYVQPLYDLAFLLEVDAIAKGAEVPKYRTFSLWRAALSMDGYGTTVDRWLDRTISDEELDYIPSSRIASYLKSVRRAGTIPELKPFRSERYRRCLRLRAVRGLGPSQIALTVSSRKLSEDWIAKQSVNLSLLRDRIAELYEGPNLGPWETAHVVPPLLRFLRQIEVHLQAPRPVCWQVTGLSDPFTPVTNELVVSAAVEVSALSTAISKSCNRQRHFRREAKNSKGVLLKHQMGWSFSVVADIEQVSGQTIAELVQALDPLAEDIDSSIQSDLHLHTSWSDGAASINSMAEAVRSSGLKFFAVTDHSRSCKLQGGLTPVLWLRQAHALQLSQPKCPVLHGIEVDILRDGSLDLPASILKAADLVIASVHSSWSEDPEENTTRIKTAIESGLLDVLAHPTSAVLGKPGVPDYVRQPASLDWSRIFKLCARWRVALEINCFPSRLDLPIDLLKQAVSVGCAISLGSDAHARSHLQHIRFGQAALRQVPEAFVLNRLSHKELRAWLTESRQVRSAIEKSATGLLQGEFAFAEPGIVHKTIIEARVSPIQGIPAGSKVVGIDLTAGDKETGVAVLDGFHVETASVSSDNEILEYIARTSPAIVSIDSPLGLPGGGDEIDRNAGIVRVAEHDLASIGIPAYPALIDSMEKLTLRGIGLRRQIEALPKGPKVIESYPGAAQDILSIPRKQKSLDQLREGLRRLGLSGPGLNTRSHDEMDAITSALVGRFYESGAFAPMGVPKEAQLIVPKISPIQFDEPPIICLAGKTGAGKSVVARYLTVFYGFTWLRTREIIGDLLVEDIAKPKAKRLWAGHVDPKRITEDDLRQFGGVILDIYKQAPLRKKLQTLLSKLNGPVVIDSIRHTIDVEGAELQHRGKMIWFVDCNESVLRSRLLHRSKLGAKVKPGQSPVDHTATLIRTSADAIIENSGSLEDLRWKIDNELFDRIEVETKL